jgi:phenylacetate-coenzyme A ligase PaaK-like adenylate-forming protein
MASDFDPWRAGWLALDALWAPAAPPAALAARRERRWQMLRDAAARGSPFWRARFARHGGALADQPPLAKRELMAHFDEAVTDPCLSLAALARFAADPARIGEPFAGRFVVWESSGSSGEPGLFVQDAAAMAVYDTLEALRRPAGWRRLFDPMALGERIAFVGALGGHFASIVSVQRLRRVVPGLADRLRAFSILAPAAELAAGLTAFRPTLVATYPTAALLLAELAQAGQLAIAPREVWTGGEGLSAAVREEVARAFGCRVLASYGASEFLALAADCAHGRLHLNADWAVLEPVDERGRAVPEGECGARAWLTNLANVAQPLVRYELGDRVRFVPGPCACGSALPVIEVEGRVDDALRLLDAQGHAVRLLPLALTTVLEEEAGLYDFQLVQQGPRALALTVAQAVDDARLAQAEAALADHLRRQGVRPRLQVRRGAAQVKGRSGKVPRVVAAPR